MNKVDVCVYVACKMTGRDTSEMINRAHYVCNVLKAWGITPISPVIEEKVDASQGILVQSTNERLKGFWQRDKDIIVNTAHVVLIDEGERKSLGVEREYGFSRYCLWKPTITILNLEAGPNIACFEDDNVVQTTDAAAAIIVQSWGTRKQRCIWRIKMLARTLPKWIYRQLLAWR